MQFAVPRHKIEDLSGGAVSLLLLGHVLKGKVTEGTTDEQEEVDADSETRVVAAGGGRTRGGGSRHLGSGITGLQETGLN